MAEGNNNKGRIIAFSIIALLLIISFIYVQAHPVYIYLVAYTWFGVSYGVLQQWGRFCFASAWRDLIGMRVTRMFVGIMIALVVLAVIEAVLEVYHLSTFNAAPLGWPELAGGLIFGLGMVLAGGCATGTLYKTGEGNLSSAVALFAIIFSQALFVDIGGYFDRFMYTYILKGSHSSFPHSAAGDGPVNPTIIRLSDYLFGETGKIADLGNAKYFVGDAFLSSFVMVAILFIGVYYVVVRADIMTQRKRDGNEAKMTMGDHVGGFCEMITSSKRTAIAGTLIGIVAAVNILVIQGLRDRFAMHNFGTAMSRDLGTTQGLSLSGTVFDPGYWYITSQEAQLGAWVLEKFGMNMMDNFFFGVRNGIPSPLINPLLWLSIGLILGATVMALLSNEFKWKKPNRELFMFALVGGTLMGIGARLAMGCNIGGFFIRAAGGDPGGWVFFAGMGGGAFVSVKFMTWWTERQLDLDDFDIDME